MLCKRYFCPMDLFRGLHACFAPDITSKYCLLFTNNGGLVCSKMHSFIDIYFSFNPECTQQSTNPDWILDCLEQNALLPRHGNAPLKRLYGELSSIEFPKYTRVLKFNHEPIQINLDSVSIESLPIVDWPLTNNQRFQTKRLVN